MAYRYRPRRQRARVGSWELVGLIAVLGGWYASSVVLSHVIGLDLSGISQVATFVGYTPPDQVSHAVVGFVPGSSPASASANVSAAAPPQTVASAPAAETYCQSGQVPHYANGFQILKDQLGDVMGNPVECEHPVDTSGNTQQKTSTGMATYSKTANATVFTAGSTHWQVTATGLRQWEGDGPAPTS
jgi:hypothetical protein